MRMIWVSSDPSVVLRPSPFGPKAHGLRSKTALSSHKNVLLFYFPSHCLSVCCLFSLEYDLAPTSAPCCCCVLCLHVSQCLCPVLPSAPALLPAWYVLLWYLCQFSVIDVLPREAGCLVTLCKQLFVNHPTVRPACKNSNECRSTCMSILFNAKHKQTLHG